MMKTETEIAKENLNLRGLCAKIVQDKHKEHLKIELEFLEKLQDKWFEHSDFDICRLDLEPRIKDIKQALKVYGGA